MSDEFKNMPEDGDGFRYRRIGEKQENANNGAEDLYQFRYRNAEPVKQKNKPVEVKPQKELYYKETIKPKKKKHLFAKVIAVCCCAALVGGLAYGAGYAIGERRGYTAAESEQGKPASVGVVQTAASAYNSEGNTATAVINKVAAAVVNIKTVVKGEQTYFYGYSIPYEAESAGSGVMFYEDEQKVYVATNNHVVENATSLFVTINDGKEEGEIPASLVGADSASDLAVISMLKTDLKEAGVEDVTLAVFGDSDLMEVGQDIIVIGNALGSGQSATGGWISAVQKSITIDGVTLDVIQTDAAINPGNSGGAMINYNGEVVGIPTAKSIQSGSEGMGYAIPSNEAVPIIEQLLESGSVPKPFLGISGQNVTEEIAEMYRLPEGVLIREVVEGSAADKAGIEVGDIIIGFNGKEIENMDELLAGVTGCEIGQSVEVKIYRGEQGSSRTLTVTATIQDANS